jgi:Cu(I)/Ag(I) efflux system protein CusF
MKRFAALAITGALSFAGLPADAQSPGMQGMDMKNDPGAKAAATSHRGSGVVKSVDHEKGTVSIAHGPVPTMNWPAMTMTFKVRDKNLLDRAKQGAKVEFSFVQSGKEYTITAMSQTR